MEAAQVEEEGCCVFCESWHCEFTVHNQSPSKMGRTMEESGEQCTVVFALIVNEQASDFVSVP